MPAGAIPKSSPRKEAKKENEEHYNDEENTTNIVSGITESYDD